ncbi:MAG: transposase, partial [Prevotellaceae bacterium]|nr:transposase [Candidatus Faecinaster equi]
MPIPQKILDVKRPINTIVKKSGDRYLVIKRTCIRKNGKPYPVALGTVGEIINDTYVKIRDEPRKKLRDSIDIKDYGEVTLCNNVAGDLLQELADTFDIKTAKTLYTIALLRSSYIDIKNRDIQVAYETSFASEMYSGLSMSENSISNFLLKVGMEYRYIHQFMNKRVENMTAPNKKLVIDGMLKDNNSQTNSYSEFSRKGAKKGSKDDTLVYAYDPETKELVAAKLYPGNMLDQRSVEDFVSSYKLTKCLMIADKGYFTVEVFKKLKQIEGLTYVVPIKNNCKLVKDNNIIGQINALLKYKDEVIFYKKVKLDDGNYLYAYKDPKCACEQEIGYVQHSQKKDTYTDEKHKDKLNEFGVIVFLSQADLDPLTIYEAYETRWDIEVMFSLYKTILDLDTVNVQGDYRLIATEFINFLSVIITTRVRKVLSETDVVVDVKKNGEVVKKKIAEIY